MWSKIFLNFGEDETTNFSSRKEITGISNLYEAQTVATISSSTEVTDIPGVVSSSSQEFVALAIDFSLCVFKSDFSEAWLNIHFESKVERIAISQDSQLLIVAEHCGSLHVFYLPAKHQIIGIPLITSAENAETFKSLFIHGESKKVEIVVFGQGQLFVYSHINMEDLRQVAANENWSSVQQYLLSVKKYQFSLNELYPGSQIETVFLIPKCSALHLGYCGMGQYPLASGFIEEWGIHLSHATGDFMFRKAEVSSDGRYIFALDTMGVIHVICSRTLLHLRTLRLDTIVDFSLAETTNPRSGAVIDKKLICLVRREEGLYFEVVQFPSLSRLYYLTVSSDTHVLKVLSNQENMYVVEAVWVEIENGNKSLLFRVRQIFEALPEAKMAHLLRKQKYDEAENFALLFNLDIQEVYKAKCISVMAKISPWLSEPLTRKDAEEVIFVTKALLDKIQDLSFVVNSCLNATPTSAELMKDLLQYASAKVIQGQYAHKEIWMRQINEASKRLVTFQALYPSEVDWCNWFQFKNCHLMTEFFKLLRTDQAAKGFFFWESHKDELCDMLNDNVICEILQSIPENVPSKELYHWLRDSFLAPVLYCSYSSIEELLKWLMQRAKILELSEKDDWPDNSLILLEVFPNTCEIVCSMCQQGGPSVAMELSIYLLQKNAALKTSSLHSLLALISNLKELALLRKKYKCPLSLTDFCQEDKVTVVFLILDWLIGTKYMDEAMNSFLIKFIKSESLNADLVFLKYIKETLAAFPGGWWHWEKAPWEDRIFHILKYIVNPEKKMAAITEILNQAPVPWSPAISSLVEEQIENSSKPSDKDNLETQKKLVKLKVVLLKYSVRNFNISNSSNAGRVMRFILEQLKPTALEDALVIARSFGHLKDIDAYFMQMTIFLKNDMLDDFTSLLEKMSVEMLESCVRRMLVLIDGQLMEFDSWRDKDQVKAMTYGGLYALKYFLQVHPDQGDEVQAQMIYLQRVWRLQVEYDLYYPLSDIQSSERCWERLKKEVACLLDDQLKSSINDVSKPALRKHASQVSYSKIYRLGFLLGLQKDEIMGHLALQLADRKATLQAVSLCMEISNSYFRTAVVLLDDIQHFYENLHTFQDTVTVEMFQSIYKTLVHAAAYCDASTYTGTGNLQQCISVASWTHLISSLCALDTQTIHYQQEDKLCDWKHSSIYLDKGLRIERKKYMPQLIAFVNKTCFPKSSMDKSTHTTEDLVLLLREVISHLRSKGQEAAALRVIILAFFTIYPCLSESEQQEVSTAVQSVQYQIIKSLLARIVKTSAVDRNLAVDLLCTLESKALHCFKELMNTCGGEFGGLKSISAIGMMYGVLENQPKILYKCQNIYKKAVWGGRLSSLNISLQDVQSLESSEQVWKVLQELFNHSNDNLPLILLFCDEFGISRDTALHEYLTMLLTTKVQEWSNAPEEKSSKIVNDLIQKAEDIIREFDDKMELLSCLKAVVEKLNPYCYEVIEFVLKNLLLLCPLEHEKRPFVEKGLKLIRFLKIYKRANRSPTDLEMDIWLTNDYQIEQLPCLVTVRLPFYELLGPHMWKIVSGELSATNVDLWLTIAPLLNLDRDQIVVISVQNTFTKWMSKVQNQPNSSAWQINHQLLEVLHRLGSRINDIEVAIACSSWVLKRLPVGPLKVQAAKVAVSLAKRWVANASDEKSKQCLRKLTITYHRLAIEQVLLDYDLTQPEYLALSQNPDQLITLILEKTAGEDKIFTSGYSKSVHSAVKEIAAIGDSHLGNVCQKLLEKWLPHPESLQNLHNETATLQFNWACVQSYEEKDNTITNLNRTINLLPYAPLADSTLEQLGIVLKENTATTLQRIQALLFLLIVADETTIESVSGCDSATVRQNLQELMFLSQLESIHLPYSLEMFRDWNKRDLVESILQSHIQNPKAMLLASSLCLQYQLWEESLWETILNNIVQLNMVSVLELVLLKLGSKSFLWHNSAFILAWNCVLKDALRRDDSLLTDRDSQGLNTFFKMMSCPCILYIDLDFFRREFESHGCVVPAAVCSLIKSHSRSSMFSIGQIQQLQEKFAKVRGLKHRLIAFSPVFQFAGRGND